MMKNNTERKPNDISITIRIRARMIAYANYKYIEEVDPNNRLLGLGDPFNLPILATDIKEFRIYNIDYFTWLNNQSIIMNSFPQIDDIYNWIDRCKVAFNKLDDKEILIPTPDIVAKEYGIESHKNTGEVLTYMSTTTSPDFTTTLIMGKSRYPLLTELDCKAETIYKPFKSFMYLND